jgi:hypothetical protein
MFDREAIPYEAAFLAGKVVSVLSAAGRNKAVAASRLFHRRSCGRCRYLLMTRDAARYRTYFPKLSLICPG